MPELVIITAIIEWFRYVWVHSLIDIGHTRLKYIIIDPICRLLIARFSHFDTFLICGLQNFILQLLQLLRWPKRLFNGRGRPPFRASRSPSWWLPCVFGAGDRWIVRLLQRRRGGDHGAVWLDVALVSEHSPSRACTWCSYFAAHSFGRCVIGGCVEFKFLSDQVIRREQGLFVWLLLR